MTPMAETDAFKLRKESTTAYIGLGSNLGERDVTLHRAVDELGRLPGTRVVAVSRFRETEPVGVTDQPMFVNAAARIETSLRPRELLDALLEIERRLGRDRSAVERWGPRTIDLDLLLYGEETVDEPGLCLPHPRLHERRFALEPLNDLDPELIVAGKGPVSALLAGLE
jgi:2-amino-4-hydroxy-6-hydroxymethyldihydropteridine diphosphokinase